MAETPQIRSKFFELPEPGDLKLPTLELCADQGSEHFILQAVENTDRNSDKIRIVPDAPTWRMNFGDSGSAYLKTYLQINHYYSPPKESHNVYEVDSSPSGEVMGWGFAVRHLNATGIVPNYAFVGNSRTMAGFLNQGLGIRRLLILNEACKQIYNEPLASGPFIDTSPDSPALLAWKELVEKGYAVELDDSYRFRA